MAIVKKGKMAKNVEMKNEAVTNYKGNIEKGKGPSKKAAVATAKKNEGFGGKKKK